MSDDRKQLSDPGPVWDLQAAEAGPSPAFRRAAIKAAVAAGLTDFRIAISTADLTDEEMAALQASRTPLEHDYEPGDE